MSESDKSPMLGEEKGQINAVWRLVGSRCDCGHPTCPNGRAFGEMSLLSVQSELQLKGWVYDPRVARWFCSQHAPARADIEAWEEKERKKAGVSAWDDPAPSDPTPAPATDPTPAPATLGTPGHAVPGDDTPEE